MSTVPGSGGVFVRKKSKKKNIWFNTLPINPPKGYIEKNRLPNHEYRVVKK